MTRAPVRVLCLETPLNGAHAAQAMRVTSIFLLCRAAFGSNQVSNFRCALRLELLNRLLQNAVSIGDPFVLAQMFEPGFHQKILDHPTLVGGVLEHTPGVGTVPPALTAELFKCR